VLLLLRYSTTERLEFVLASNSDVHPAVATGLHSARTVCYCCPHSMS
jgi:hypothetical protein